MWHVTTQRQSRAHSTSLAILMCGLVGPTLNSVRILYTSASLLGRGRAQSILKTRLSQNDPTMIVVEAQQSLILSLNCIMW